jgi:hypothetical protein
MINPPPSQKNNAPDLDKMLDRGELGFLKTNLTNIDTSKNINTFKNQRK